MWRDGDGDPRAIWWRVARLGCSRDGARVETHYWNRLPSGIEVDLTREQFRRGETFGEPRVIDPATSRAPRPESVRRVRLLSSRVHEAIGNEAMHLSPS